MNNFDFTQFVSFDSVLPYQIICDSIVNIFEISDFEVISIKDIESVKKEYFSVYWSRYIFELKNDSFLEGFMEWESPEIIPETVKEFIKILDKILALDISRLRVIISSFAEKDKTDNQFIVTKKQNIYKELFKMSPFSYVCPQNLIISIADC